MWTLAYVLSIAAVNWGFAHVPLVPLFGEMWPPLSLAVGLIFVLRDFAQREAGHFVLAAMALGALLSWWLADPYVALASVAAFALSEGADWSVYTLTKRPLAQRVLLSSALSAPIDSAVFLVLIGHFSLTGVAVMSASKMVGAVVVFFLLRSRQHAFA